MNTKKFEYDIKDKKSLKNDIIFRIFFTILFISIFAWQFTLLLLSKNEGTLSTLKIYLGLSVLFTCLIFVIISMMYIAKNLKILDQLKFHSKAVVSVTVLSSGKKGGFLRLYKFISEVIAIIMLVLAVCAITYSVLEFMHYSTISFYLPLISIITLTGFNTVYHINNELKIIENVRAYNSVY